MRQQFKNLVSILLRFGLSGALLMWLFSKIDFRHMWEAVRGSDWRYMLLAGSVFLGINFLILWRWRILMKAVGVKEKAHCKSITSALSQISGQSSYLRHMTWWSMTAAGYGRQDKPSAARFLLKSLHLIGTCGTATGTGKRSR